MFIKIRITPECCVCDTKIDDMLKSILKRYDDGDTIYTWGIENHNKFGEETKEHLHFHAYIGNGDIAEISLGAHQKWFRENLHAKGNKSYYVKLLGDCKDHKKFFQYPFKQHTKFNTKIGFSKKGWSNYFMGVTNNEEDADEWMWSISNLIATASGEYDRTVEMNVKTRERMENKNMFWMKLVNSLKSKYGSLHLPDKTIWIDIVKFYIDNGKTPPWASINDKVLHFKVEVGQCTVGS